MLKRAFILGIILAMLLTACNLPQNGASTPDADIALTAAAQTVAAVLTAQADTSGEASTEAAPTVALPNTPVQEDNTAAPPTAEPPTPTPLPPSTATATPRPCNQATFVADVTVPDGTQLPPGDNFIKVWRLKNVGTCSWTPQYALVFDSGAQMSGPVVQQLTSTVNPGETVDIAVTLIAPNAPGSYRGYWRLRDASGATFGLSNGNAFWVDIQVVAAAPTSTPFVFVTVPVPTIGVVLPVTTTLTPASGGFVTSGGQVNTYAKNSGDKENNESAQAFATFDLSGLPAGANITSASINLSNHDFLGTPFASLGCMRMYPQDYGTLDASDFFSGSASGAVGRWCSDGELNADQDISGALSYLNSHVGGSAQFRFQFNNTATNNDGIADMVRMGDIQLTITYTP